MIVIDLSLLKSVPTALLLVLGKTLVIPDSLLLSCPDTRSCQFYLLVSPRSSLSPPFPNPCLFRSGPPHLYQLVPRTRKLCCSHFKRQQVRGAWVVQFIKRRTLDFSSGPDLAVCEFEPCVGLCTDSAEPAWDFLSPSLSAPPLHMLSLSK